MAARDFCCMAAVEVNSGIGYRGDIPWPMLKRDLKFLKQKTVQTQQNGKMNAVIMGRLTWESLPTKLRPLPKRYNIVLSSKTKEEIGSAHSVCATLQEAITVLQTPPLSEEVEAVFVLGGASVYKEAMCSAWCRRLYITKVLETFTCDTFYPPIDPNLYTVMEEYDEPLLPKGTLEENGIKFKFVVYERRDQ